MITPRQCRMARSALNVSQQTVGDAVNVSKTALSGWEQGKPKLSNRNIAAIRRYFEKRSVFFGPHESVSFGKDIFAGDRTAVDDVVQTLREHGYL